MTEDARMWLVSPQGEDRLWDTDARVQFFRDTFRQEITAGGDELAMFARLVCVLGEPARLLAELRVGMGERREADVRSHAAVGLEYCAAACLEVAERLRNPRS